MKRFIANCLKIAYYKIANEELRALPEKQKKEKDPSEKISLEDILMISAVAGLVISILTMFAGIVHFIFGENISTSFKIFSLGLVMLLGASLWGSFIADTY